MKDFLEQLAEIEVRDPPPEFDRQLHQRLNRSLVVQHVVELVTGAAPWALGHFFRALGGFVAFTLTGEFADDGRPEK
ncbi:MAG: hypothetical protein ABR915_13825 [Thermoguttaceae bacterium]|jgi:protein required for attachment to host cells